MQKDHDLKELIAKQTNDLDNANSYIKSILDNLIDGVITIDLKGIIKTINPAVTKIFGYSEEELAGKNINILMPEPFHSDHDSYLKNYLDTGKANILGIGREVQGKRKSGEIFPVDLSVAEIKSDGNHYFTGLIRDISDRVELEKQIKLAQTRYEQSQTFANIGTWDWNIQTGDLYWSDRIAPLFGYPKGELETTYDNFLASVHPDDRQKVIDAVNDCVEKSTEYNIEHRCVWPDGTVRWLLEKGDVNRSEDGTPLNMLGVVQDITDRKFAEEKLTITNKILQQIASGDDIDFILSSVVSSIEELLEGAICSILILKDDNKLYTRGNNRLPDFYNEAINGIEAIEGNGSCGTSAYLNEPVIVSDLYKSPYWANYIDLAKKAELSACWSEPIRSLSSKPFGTFAIYYKEPRSPNTSELDVIKAAAQLASIALLREQHEDSLHTAKNDAIKANKAKSEFLSQMSHELRTPLNAIIGFSQLLEIDGELKPDQLDSVNEIHNAGDHLLKLINEILDLSRIESGNLEVKNELVNLSDIVNHCINLTQNLAHNKNIKIERKSLTQYDTLNVIADKTRLKQAILNLISNAIKYNKQDGYVYISCNMIDDEHIQISIKDNGLGIAQDNLEKLFTPFNRLGAENSNIEGTGIGLVITRQLIELMGGTISVESEEGIGSTFTVTLKKASTNKEIDNDSEHTSNRVNTTVNGKTVIYIEDNPINLKFIKQAIKKRPHIDLFSTESPEQGIELIKNKMPDLILLDINLPGMSGFDVIEILKQDSTTADIPVIAVSANAMKSDIDKGKEAGFDNYLTKPVDLAAFYDMLDSYLG